MFRVNVINGNDMAMNALVYKQPDLNVLEYVTNNLNKVVDKVNEYGQAFVDMAVNAYNKFNSDHALNYNKLVLQSAGVHLDPNTIYYVPVENLGLANNIMQRYIIAQPEMNTLYKKEMCYGYQDSYVVLEEGMYGKDNIEYRRVMDGVLEFEDTEEGEGYVTYYVQDDEDIYPEELSRLDKISILDTWNSVDISIGKGIDPTDPDKGKL